MMEMKKVREEADEVIRNINELILEFERKTEHTLRFTSEDAEYPNLYCYRVQKPDIILQY